MDTAEDLFLHRGYGGVRIDDIVDEAGVSRASFYTYFPSKKDILLAIGENAYAEGRAVSERAAKIPRDWTRADIVDWVTSYMDFLEDHGAFIGVWNQATWDDEALKSAGLRTQMATARILGRHLQALRRNQDIPAEDPVLEGLTFLAMFQRLWQFWRVAKAPFSRRQITEIITDLSVAWLERS